MLIVGFEYRLKSFKKQKDYASNYTFDSFATMLSLGSEGLLDVGLVEEVELPLFLLPPAAPLTFSCDELILSLIKM